MQIKSQLTLNHALWGAKYWILFAIFLLVALKVSDKNEHIPYIFDWVPLLGGTLPYTLTGLVIMLAFSANGGKFSETGLFWPPSKTLWRGLLWIMGFAVLTLFARASVPMLLGPLFDLIGPRHSSAEHFQSLVNNLPLLLVILPLMWIVVFFEEWLFRGVLLTSIAQHLNFRKYAWVVAIVFSSALFGALHFWKGYRGMVSTAIGALAYSTAYVLLKRNLWPCVVAHCLGNTLGFISVYQDD